MDEFSIIIRKHKVYFIHCDEVWTIFMWVNDHMYLAVNALDGSRFPTIHDVRAKIGTAVSVVDDACVNVVSIYAEILAGPYKIDLRRIDPSPTMCLPLLWRSSSSLVFTGASAADGLYVGAEWGALHSKLKDCILADRAAEVTPGILQVIDTTPNFNHCVSLGKGRKVQLGWGYIFRLLKSAGYSFPSPLMYYPEKTVNKYVPHQDDHPFVWNDRVVYPHRVEINLLMRN